MGIKILTLILGSVALSAIAQLLLKLGMSSSAIQSAIEQGRSLQIGWAAATNPQVVAGLGLYGLGAVVWLLVLARVDLSFAYPFVGLGMIVTMFLGWSVLGETLGPARLAGTLLVVAGVWLVSKS